MLCLLGTIIPLPATASGLVDSILTRPWQAALSIEGAYNDNLQEQPGPNREEDWFTSMEGRLDLLDVGWKTVPTALAAILDGRLYSHFTDFNYMEVRLQSLHRLGRNQLLLRYGYTPRRLLYAQEDGGPGAFYHENFFDIGWRRRFGEGKRLRISILAEQAWYDFRPAYDDRDSFVTSVESNARYDYGWIVPHLGFEYAQRFSQRENYDRNKYDIGAGFDMLLPFESNLRFRYELSVRDYTVGSPRQADGRRNSNFGRNDGIQEWDVEVTIPVRFFPGLLTRARVRVRDGDSDDPARNFIVHEYGLEIAYVFLHPTVEAP